MIGVSVVFDYDGNFDRFRVVEVAKNARKMFEGLPGLRFKAFTLDEKQQRAINFYCGIHRRRRKPSSPTNSERGWPSYTGYHLL